MNIRQILNLQRRQLMALAEKGSVRRLRGTYELARGELEEKLRRLVHKGRGESFTAHHIRVLLAQVQDALGHFEKDLAFQLIDDGKKAGTLAGRHLISSVNEMEKQFTGLAPVLQTEQAAVFRGLLPQVDRSLLDRYKTSIQAYGRPVLRQVRDELAMSSLLGETVNDAVDRIVAKGGIFEQQRWRAERIVRTETAYAYGVTKQKGMAEMKQRDFPDMQKKLIATFDSRTGEDSKELHGQVQDVDKPFIWKVRDARGNVKKTVKYMHPPNRPNDREVVIPWRPGWREDRWTAPRV